MNLLYPSKIIWRLDLTPDQTPETILGKTTYKRVIKTLPLLEAAGYRFVIEPITDAWLNDFAPLYQEHIGKKNNSIVFDIIERVHEGQQAGKEYFVISLYHQQVLCGGLIFASLNNTFRVAFRVFPLQTTIKTPTSASYVAEYLLLEHAFAQHISKLSHGRDRNAYGINTSIGLALYKLRVGGQPFAAPGTEFLPIADLATQSADPFLVFLADTPDQPCRSALFYSTDPIKTQDQSQQLER